MSRQSLGELEMLVLLAALRLGEDRAYAVSIADEILAQTGRKVQRATVYVTLQRLEQKGIVSTHLGDPRPERGGKARRYVRVDRAGRERLDELHRALSRMWQGLEPAFEGPS